MSIISFAQAYMYAYITFNMRLTRECDLACPSTYFTAVNPPGSFTISARTLGPPSQGVPLTIHYIHTYSSKNYERQSLPLNIFTLCMCRQSCIYFAKCDSCNYVKQTLLSQINKSVLNSYSYSTI